MPFIILKSIVQKSRKYVRTFTFREELDSAIKYYITIDPGVYPLVSQWRKTAEEYLTGVDHIPDHITLTSQIKEVLLLVFWVFACPYAA